MVYFYCIFLLFVFFLSAKCTGRCWKPHESTTKGTPLNTFVAYQIVSGACTLYTAGLGWYGTFYDYGTTNDDRLYGRSDTALLLGEVMTAYQMWNLVVCCLFVKEYCTVNFIVHHFTTMLLSSTVLHPYVNHYALFYIGIAETSSIPLTVMDNIKFLKLGYPRLLSLARGTFGALFFALRVVAWTYVNVYFWYDHIVNRHRIHSVPVVALFLVSNVGLTGLQYYWGYLIGRRLVK